MAEREMKTTGAIIKRDLDGIYIRVRVDGEWQNRCLTDLHWEDVEDWLRGAMLYPNDAEGREEKLLRVIKHLHERLRAFGDQLEVEGVG